MAWITLTETELERLLTSAELEAVRTRLVSPTQPDPALEALERASAEVRGYVAASGRVKMGPAGTVPPELAGAVGAIARWRLLTRLAGVGSGGLATDARRKDYEDAVALLRQVAAGGFAVEAHEPTDEPARPADGAWGSAERFEP